MWRIEQRGGNAMQKGQVLFESYNKAIEQCYENLFKNNNNEELVGIKENDVGIVLKVCLDAWVDSPLSELDGYTPKEYVAGVESFEDVVGLFKLGAKMCDHHIPNILVDSLKQFKNEAVTALMDIAVDREFINDSDDFLISAEALRVLGLWKEKRAVDTIIQLLYDIRNDEESVIAERAADTLIDIGQPAIESTTTAIVECGFLSNKDEESRLQTDEYRDKLAVAIKEGINRYFKQK